MKTLGYISLTAILLLASCSSRLYTSSGEYDDVYYIPNRTEAVIVAPSATTVPSVNNLDLSPSNIQSIASDTVGMTDYEKYRWAMEREALGESSGIHKSEEGYYDDEYAYTQSEQYYDSETGTTIINNHYYGNVYDNHDLYYSSRFRRFHRPYYSIGYYDPFYTDMFYYGFGPSYWGMSIYYGSPWRSWYSPWGYDYYYGYSPWSYGWGSPWYYGHSYYGSYRTGYRHGFYDGYYGYSPYGYGYGWYSYRTVQRDDRNYYYGHRSSRSGYTPYSTSASGTAIRKSTTQTSDPRLRSRAESVSTDARKADNVSGVDVANRSRTLDGNTGAVRQATTTGGAQRSVAGAAERQRVNDAGTGAQRSVGGTTRSTERTQSTTGVYQRPAAGQDVVRSAGTGGTNANTYTPSYTRPRTTSAPTYNRSESSPAQGTVKSGTTTTRSAVSPSVNYTRPTTTTTTRPATTRPATTTRPSTTPTRPATTTPARTSPSYSRPAPAPSQSSPTYSRPSSAPSRSTYSAPASTPSSSSYSAPASTPSRSSYSAPSSTPSRSSSSSSGSSGGGATRSSSSSGSGRR